MPRFHQKCPECDAPLGPRGVDVPEGWMHKETCSRYESPDATQAAQQRVDTFNWGPPQVCSSYNCLKGPFGMVHAMDCQLFVPKEGLALPSSDATLTDKWIAKSGASSSEKAPPFHLIPLEVLIAEARRYGLGEVKHGRGNFEKACGSYKQPAEHDGQDKEWMIDRINHGILHALRWLAKMEGLIPWSDDDDAGAVQWLGGVMRVYENEWKRRREAASESAV